MQAVDLVELKHHPIIVVVSGIRRDNLLRTYIGYINIKEDIMAPLFPPIATHLADNPKIFLFIVKSSSFERHAHHFTEPVWENCIVGYIAYDDLSDMQVTDIVEEKLAHPSLSVQEIFTSICDKLLPFATMTVIDRLKEPVYLHPRGSELMPKHARISSMPPTFSHLRGSELMEIHSRLPKRARIYSHPHGSKQMKTHGRLGSRPHFQPLPPTFNRSRSQGIVTCL